MTATTYELLVQADDVVVELVGDECVVFAPADQALHHLDRSATLVWQCLAEPVTTDDLVADFAAVFGVSTEQIRDHLRLVIDPLLASRAVLTTGDGCHRSG